MLSLNEWLGLVALAGSIVGSIWGSAVWLATKFENHTVRLDHLEKRVDRHDVLFDAHSGGQ